MLLQNNRIQSSLRSYMKTILYDFESYAMQNRRLLRDLKRVRLVFNNGKSCFTNGNTIVIGRNFPPLKSTENNNLIYKRAQGITAHEVAHILYTDFKVTSTFFNTSTSRYKKLSGAAKEIFNILEDYRIEETMSRHNPYLKRLFLMIRFELIKDLIEDLRKMKIYDDQDRASFMMNALLVMGFTQKPFLSGDPKTDQMVQMTYFFVMNSIKSETTQDILENTDQIMQLIQKLDIKEQKEIKISINMSGLLGKMTPKGSHSPISGDSVGAGLGKNVDGYAGDVGVVEDIGKNLEKVEQELSEQEDTTEETMNQLSNEFNDELTRIEKMTVTESIINGYFNETKNDKIQKKKIEEEKKLIESFGEEMPSIHNGLPLVINDVDEAFTQEDYDAQKNQMIVEIKKVVNELENLIEHKIEDYEHNLKSGSLDVSSVARFMALGDTDIFKQQYPEDEVISMDVMLLIDCSGSNASEVLNKKNDVFIPRYKLNQMMAIYLHEILKEMNFKHSVWGFSSGSREDVYPMITFQECFNKTSGLKLANIDAKSANRDGYHIRLAGKTLDANAESKNKLLIVLSDGQPSAMGYNGKQAMLDVVESQNELKEFGIKTVGIFTGHKEENKYFEDMYENHYFLNNESISDFPKVLYDILYSNFKDSVI